MSEEKERLLLLWLVLEGTGIPRARPPPAVAGCKVGENGVREGVVEQCGTPTMADEGRIGGETEADGNPAEPEL